MVIVLMGPAGVGKSTIGLALALRLRWRFVDADDLHAPASIEKMSRGIGLTDDDRASWLDRVNAAMRAAADGGENLVVACSALREGYRARLSGGVPALRWVRLRVDAAVLEARLAARRDHFAGPALLETQLAAFEPPRDAIEIDAEAPMDSVVDAVCRALHLRC